jgi:hypothetical protein
MKPATKTSRPDLRAPKGAGLPGVSDPPATDTIRPEAEALLDALLATGAPMGEAAGLAAQGIGETAIRPLWRRWIQEVIAQTDQALKNDPNPSQWVHNTNRDAEVTRILTALGGVAAAVPEAATLWLGFWLTEQPWRGRSLFCPSWAKELPANLAIRGDLDLRYASFRALPKGLKVAGTLHLNAAQTQALPDGYRVRGSLNVDGSHVTALPRNLKVRYHLDFRDTRLAALPEGLEVGATLYLADTAIETLPEGLVLRGTLSLCHSLIQALPPDLQIAGNLNLRHSRITKLPERLWVKGSVFLYDAPSWDGQIPSDTRIDGFLHTEGHRNKDEGVPLPEWRRLHPEGERP